MEEVWRVAGNGPNGAGLRRGLPTGLEVGESMEALRD